MAPARTAHARRAAHEVGHAATMRLGRSSSVENDDVIQVHDARKIVRFKPRRERQAKYPSTRHSWCSRLLLFAPFARFLQATNNLAIADAVTVCVNRCSEHNGDGARGRVWEIDHSSTSRGHEFGGKLNGVGGQRRERASSGVYDIHVPGGKRHGSSIHESGATCFRWRE